VLLSTITWNESDSAGADNYIDPWNLFFSDARVKKKIDNYSFLRCKLKIKVVVNASPFYYGAMRFCYIPARGYKNEQILFDGSNLNHLIPYSQTPGFWIYPSSSTGGEMELPFFVS